MLRMRTVVVLLAAIFLGGMGVRLQATTILLNEGDPITSFFDYNQQIPNPSGGYYTEFYKYTNFTVPKGETWNVSEIFADLGVVGAANITGFNYEFRTGMNGGNGGTIIASGTIHGNGDSSRVAFAGESLNGGEAPLYQYTFDVSGFHLPVLTSGQTYWFSLVPVVPNGYNIWLAGTNHVNEVNSLEDNFSEQFGLNSSGSAFFTDSHDYATGLEGTLTTTTPEPAALLLFGTGLLGIAFIVGLRKRHGRIARL